MRTLIAAGRNSLLGLAVVIVVVSACSDDEGGDGAGSTGGRGGTGNSGSGGESVTGGKGGGNATAGKGGGSSTGGRSGTTGGSSGMSGAAGESGAAGQPDGGRGPMGGAGGESPGGAGGELLGGAGGSPDRESTLEEICGLYCPPGESHPLEEVGTYCGEPANTGIGPGAYDQATCYRDCLGNSDYDVAAACGDEAMLYATCRLNIDNWECRETGGGKLWGCVPVYSQLAYCAARNPRT